MRISSDQSPPETPPLPLPLVFPEVNWQVHRSTMTTSSELFRSMNDLSLDLHQYQDSYEAARGAA